MFTSHSHITIGKGPVPLLVDIVIPVGVEDEVHEPVSALSRHPAADSPTIVRVVHGVVRLPHGQPDLVQHGGQTVGAGARVQLSARQQRVTEAHDGVTVVKLKLLEVPQQNFGIKI